MIANSTWPPGMSLGIEVLTRPELLRRSSEVIGVHRGPKPALVVWSLCALRLVIAGVRWHDDSEHCRTWSDGCRCDLGDES